MAGKGTAADPLVVTGIGGGEIGSSVAVSSIAAGNNNIGDVDVASLPALPAGSNAIGKLAANSGVIIGDVNVVAVPVASNFAVASGTAGTSAAQAVASRASRRKVLIQNKHATQILYVGPSGVTTSTGTKLNPGESWEAYDFSGAVYLIASAASTDFSSEEIY